MSCPYCGAIQTDSVYVSSTGEETLNMVRCFYCNEYFQYDTNSKTTKKFVNLVA